MSKGDSKSKKTKKASYFAKLEKLLEDYSKIFIVEADNVGSQQFHQIRRSLRGEAVILMGKNTMIRKVVRGRMATNPDLEKLLPFIRGNIGFVFTNEDLRKIRDKLLANRIEAPAKAGAIAPIDVFIEPQNTGMGPEKTSFFQALGISTKIAKGTIEISSRVHLVKKAEKVGQSESALLNMLKVSPFTYGLVVRQVYDSGSVFTSDMLDITDAVLLGHFASGVANIAAISLAIHYPTKASVPHMVLNAYKNLLAIALTTDISFKGVDQIKEILKNPGKFAAAAAPAAAAAAPAAGAKAEPKEEKKAPEPEPEEDGDMGLGLFD